MVSARGIAAGTDRLADQNTRTAYSAWQTQFDLLKKPGSASGDLLSNPFYASTLDGRASVIALRSTFHLHKGRILTSRHIPKNDGEAIWCLSAAELTGEGTVTGVSLIVTLPPDVAVHKVMPTQTDFILHVSFEGKQSVRRLSFDSLRQWANSTINADGNTLRELTEAYKKWSNHEHSGGR